MNTRRTLGSLAALLLLATGQSAIAATSAAQKKAQLDARAAAQAPKKMRGTTNTERWAAATRSADRRADQIRKNQGKAMGK